MMLQPLVTPAKFNGELTQVKQAQQAAKPEPLPAPIESKPVISTPVNTQPEKTNPVTSKPEPATVVKLSTKPTEHSLPIEPTYEALGSAGGAAKSRW